MLTAYFDDSGTSPKENVAVVAGYVGYSDQWGMFAAKWKELLDQSGIKVSHRSDMECFHGEFASWTPDKRTDFVKKADKIIQKRTSMPVGSAVIKSDFEEMVPTRLEKHIGGHFGWCVTEAVALTNSWANKINHKGPIHWVFEAGTTGQPRVNEMLSRLYANTDWRKRFRIKSWSFGDKSLLPLQAADFVAYEAYKQIQNQILDAGKYPVRLSAIDLIGEKDKHLLYWNKTRLARFFANPENTKQFSKLLSN